MHSKSNVSEEMFNASKMYEKRSWLDIENAPKIARPNL